MRPRPVALLVVCFVVAAGWAGTGSAAAVTWTPVRGALADRPLDAARDGARVLVLGQGARGLSVTTVARGAVAARQVVTKARVRHPRLLVTPSGAAVVVWSGPGTVFASHRPSRGARFGPARVVSAHPGAATGAAAAPSAAVAPDGRVLVAWWGGPAGGRLGIQASELGPSGRWSAPVEVSGGLYPQDRPDRPIGLTAASAPDGGWAVAWNQVARRGPGARAIAQMAARRSPAGAWEAPVTLGEGDAFDGSPALAAGAGGELVAAWVEARGRRPDGVAQEMCLVAARAADGTVARREPACRPLQSAGPPYLARTGGGGTLIAWTTPPEAGGPAIEVYSRAPGASEWGAGRLTVAGSRGAPGVESFARSTGGRAVLVTQVFEPVRSRDDGLIRVAVLAADGTVARRAAGPATPGRLPHHLKRFLAFAPGRVTGVLTWSSGGGGSAYRLSLLSL